MILKRPWNWFLPSFICLILLHVTKTYSATDSIAFDHIEENTLFFKSSASNTPLKSLKTGLFDMTYLATLSAPENSPPYFLLTGKPCQTCLEEKSIYIVRATGEKPTAFVYPGKILEPKSRSLALESRAFYGKCLPRKGDVYIVFQKEKVDRRSRLQSSVFIAEAAADHLSENLIERNFPRINTTLQMVKRKTCKEVEGRKRLMLNKPLDLHPKNVSDNDDEDENE